jgi:alkylation response protein AidB-like acyl-CoA dehydrogenase
MAKYVGSDMAMKVTTDAVQIFGGYGYTMDYPVERMMRADLDFRRHQPDPAGGHRPRTASIAAISGQDAGRSRPSCRAKCL